METLLELRAAEGGQDSKLLCEDMARLYMKACSMNNFAVDVLQWRDGFIVLSIDGKESYKFFSQESGSHRWQRVPPTEKRGRVQTSTVTVAVLKEKAEVEIKINPEDVEKWFSRGSGPGGQHRNKVETSVFLKHIPTGIVVKCENGRSQRTNEEEAWKMLKIKLQDMNDKQSNSEVVSNRNSQIGTGERSDKRRTYREKDDLVIDHVTNKNARFKDILKGKIDLLHK